MDTRVSTLRDRLLDTANYMRGIAAIPGGLNRAATDGMDIAIRAVEAAAEDLVAVDFSEDVSPRGHPDQALCGCAGALGPKL